MTTKQTFYDPATGVITMTTNGPGHHSVPGLFSVSGTYPADEYIIDLQSGRPVKLPPKPAGRVTLNPATRQWERDTAADVTAAQAQVRRRLRACDWTQLGDERAAMGARDAAAWDAYRAALRAVEKQPGYPDQIDWPVSPDSGENP